MEKQQTATATSLVDAHRVLIANLRELEQAVGSGTAISPTEMIQRLGALQARLASHFRLEEQGGYLDVVRTRAPHLERQVEHLLQDHRELATSLENLIREAKAAAGIDEAFRQMVQTWIGQVRDHEHRENLLAEDAFNVDLGAED